MLWRGIQWDVSYSLWVAHTDCPTSSGLVDRIAVTVALEKLRKIEDLAHFTVNSARTGHSAIASHAFGIYGNAGEAAERD